MKVLAITSAVVLVAVVITVLAVVYGGKKETQSAVEPKEFLDQFFRDVTADVCRDAGDQCAPIRLQCLDTFTVQIPHTEEDFNKAMRNITECADQVGATEADFSTLTVESITSIPIKDGAYDIVTFLSWYGVAENQVAPMMECFLERDGALDTLRTCIANNLSEST